MKLFKRTLSLFLAFMMVFTSVSLLASADLGNDGMTWKMYFKYYREADVATKDADGNYVKDADGNIVTEKVWVEATSVKAGDKVKARLYAESNYAVGQSEYFLFYPEEFLEFDPTNHTADNVSGGYKTRWNLSEGSIPLECGYDGSFFTQGTEPTGVGAYPVDEGCIDEADYEKYDWFYVCNNMGATAITYDGSDWLCEFDFIVKSDAKNYGGVFVPEGGIQDTAGRSWSVMFLSKQPDGDGGDYGTGIIFGFDEDFNYILGGPNFDYESDLVGASADQLAAAKKEFETLAEKEALKLNSTLKYNLNGGSIDGATTVADAEGLAAKDALIIPANPTKIVGSGESQTELKFLGWNKSSKAFTGEDGATYYDANDGIYYVNDTIAAEAGNANQAGLLADLQGQTFGYSEVTLTAVYQSPAKYQQNVYLQNIADDEYTLSTGYSAEIDAIGGDVVKAADYEVPTGFKLNAEKSTASITVSAETVETLNIYLDREVYTATFKSGKDGATVETKTGKFEAPLSAPTPAELVGHSFTAWNPAVPATFTADGEYVAQYASAGATITVNYSYIDKANGNKLVTGTFTKDSLTGYNYAIVEEVPAEPDANTTYITYDEILNVEHYEFDSATPASGTVTATGANVTAQFKAVEYTATFTGGTPETVGVAYYDKLTSLPEAPAAETGWQFDGWYNGDVKAVANETVITGDVTFEAKYSKIPRTVTYVYEGAPENYKPADSYTAYIGDKVVLPELPDVEGYQVGEWVISNAENGIVGTSDVTVTSTWTKNTYTVTYYADENGNEIFTTQDYEHGEALAYPEEVPGKKGYEFDAWDIAEGEPVEGELYVYPSFTAIEYYLTAIGHDGEELDLSALGYTNVYYYSNKITLADLPTKVEMDEYYAEDYYVFNKWMYNGAEITATTVIPVTGDVTVTAEIVPADAVLTFNAGGAKFANGEDTVTVNLKVWDEITDEMYPAIPEYEGHTFQSWDDYPDMMDEPAKTLTIQWKKNTYTVKYVNGLTGAEITSVTGEYGTALAAQALPTATGYTFAWDLALDSIPAKNEKGETMADGGTVTVTAVPTAENYTVTYVVDGKTVKTAGVAFGAAIDSTFIPAEADVPAGYSFIGWNLDENATAAGALGNMPASDVTVYAVLQAKGDTKYTVEIYEESLDGEYELKSSTEYFDGTAGKVAPYVVNQSVTGFTFNAEASILDELVAGDGSTVLEVYYDRKIISVVIGDNDPIDVPYGSEIDIPDEGPASPDAGQEFDKWVDEDGNEVSDPYTVPDSTDGTPVEIIPTYKNRMIDVYYYVDGKLDKTVPTEYTKPIDSTVRPTAVPAGYSFLGWNLDDKATEVGTLGNMPATEVNVYAVLEAHTNVGYSVEIYEESLDGEYELVDTKEFTNGTAGKVAPYTVDENVEGFTFNAEASILDELVAGDGSTVLEVYYDRKTITVVIGDNDPIDVPYGSEIDIPDEGPASPDAGKEFDKWVDEDGKPVSDPYTVPDSADGTPVEIIPTYRNKFINVYYYVGETLVETIATEYTKPINSSVRPATVPTGYTFLGWNLDDKATEVGTLGNMPATEVNVYAVLEAHTNVGYSVEIYEESLDGDYELVDTKEFTNGTAGKVAPYTVDENVEGFTFNAEASILDTLVSGDGSTVLEVYYNRKTITVVVGDNDPIDVPYGTEIDLPNDVDDNDPGTQFDKWVDEDGNTVSDPYTVPDSADGTPVELTPVYKNLFFDVVFIDELAGTTSSKSLEYTTKIPNPGTPSVEGYEFDGWYTENGDKYVAGTTTVPNADVTYYAKYTGLEVDYTVNVYFEKLDGSGWEDVQSTLESGVAGETAEYTETFEGFTLDTKNSVTEATIKGDGTTVLVIYFVRNDVKITVDGEEKEVPYGTEVKEEDLKADVEPGYKVEKWTDADGNDITFPVEIKGGETFVSVIVKDTFTATFQTEDGTQVGETITAEYDAVIEAPAAPAAPEGMTFRGWLDKSTNTYFNGKMSAKNTVYTAFYASNDEATYTVNIYIMNTEGVEELSGSYSATATIGTTQSVVPGTVSCCTLDTARSNTSCVILEDNSASINLYFVRGLYTVSFDGVETDVYAGAVIPVPADPEQAGQKFLGWTPAIPDVMPEEDLAFTSTWEDEIYTITYIVGDQEIVQEYKLGDTVTAYEVTTAPAGLVFDKWSAEVPATMPAKNIVVSAVFKAAAYTVTYLDAEGNVFVSYSVAFDAVVPVPTEAPEKEFYTFAGWADVPATMPNHDVTIQPIFNPIEVKLVAAPGSTTVIDRENGYIYGLEEMLTAKILDDDYLDYEGDGTLVIKPAPTGTNRYGTGAVVELYDNADGSLVETFTIIVFGDLNGDSVVNGLDVSIADDEAFYITEWSLEGSADYQAHLVFAANLDNNAVIDNIDVTIIKHHTLGVAEIDQTTGKLIRS